MRSPKALDPESREAHASYLLRILLMVRNLHRRGYGLLRIVPRWSGTGVYRLYVTHAGNIAAANGAEPIDDEQSATHTHTSANGSRLFEWPDAPRATVPKLATLFLERFTEIATFGKGEDVAYADWLQRAIRFARRGEFPQPDSSYNVYDGRYPEGLGMPPPGQGQPVAKPPEEMSDQDQADQRSIEEFGGYDDTLSFFITCPCDSKGQIQFELQAFVYISDEPATCETRELLAACPACGTEYAALNKGTDLHARPVSGSLAETYATLRAGFS